MVPCPFSYLIQGSLYQGFLLIYNLLQNLFGKTQKTLKTSKGQKVNSKLFFTNSQISKEIKDKYLKKYFGLPQTKLPCTVGQQFRSLPISTLRSSIIQTASVKHKSPILFSYSSTNFHRVLVTIMNSFQNLIIQVYSDNQNSQQVFEFIQSNMYIFLHRIIWVLTYELVILLGQSTVEEDILTTSLHVCLFCWMPSQRKESGYPIISGFASSPVLALVTPLLPSRQLEFQTEKPQIIANNNVIKDLSLWTITKCLNLRGWRKYLNLSQQAKERCFQWEKLFKCNICNSNYLDNNCPSSLTEKII